MKKCKTCKYYNPDSEWYMCPEFTIMKHVTPHIDNCVGYKLSIFKLVKNKIKELVYGRNSS